LSGLYSDCDQIDVNEHDSFGKIIKL